MHGLKGKTLLDHDHAINVNILRMAHVTKELKANFHGRNKIRNFEVKLLQVAKMNSLWNQLMLSFYQF